MHPDSTGFDSLLQDMEDVDFFRQLQDELEGEGERPPVRLRSQRAHETDSNYLDRMIRYNDRIQDREERKGTKWTDRIFGRDKEQKEPDN